MDLDHLDHLDHNKARIYFIMARQQVPGYWYDPDKHNYFRVLPDHLATPDSEYSQSAIRHKIQEQEKRNRRDEISRQRASELAPRSKLLGDAVSIGLHREHGHRYRRPLVEDDIARTYVAGIQRFENRSLFVENAAYLSMQNFKIKQPFEDSSILPSGSMFVHDALTDSWIIGGSTGFSESKVSVVASLWCYVPRTLYSAHHSSGIRSAAGARLVQNNPIRYNSDISSLDLSPSRNVVVTTYGSSVPATIRITALRDPRQENYLQNEYVVENSLETVFGLHRSQRERTIWSSAVNPFTGGASTNSADQIAVGTSNGMSFVDLASETWTIPQDPNRDSSLDEVKALSWMDPHVVAGGRSNGRVLLWDTRTNKNDLSFTHGRSVLNVKCLPEKGPYMVVAGAPHSLNLYDLRFGRKTGSRDPPEEPLSEQQPHHKHRSKHQKRSSFKQRYHSNQQESLEQQGSSKERDRHLQPVLTFAYENEYDQPGMDVRDNVLAVGDENRCIQLYSLITGELLRSVVSDDPSLPPRRPWSKQVVRCIRFVDEPGVPSYIPGHEYADKEGATCIDMYGWRNLNAGRTVLAASVGGRIVTYAWSKGDATEGKGNDTEEGL